MWGVPLSADFGKLRSKGVERRRWGRPLGLRGPFRTLSHARAPEKWPSPEILLQSWPGWVSSSKWGSLCCSSLWYGVASALVGCSGWNPADHGPRSVKGTTSLEVWQLFDFPRCQRVDETPNAIAPRRRNIHFSRFILHRKPILRDQPITVNIST